MDHAGHPEAMYSPSPQRVIGRPPPLRPKWKAFGSCSGPHPIL